MSLRAKLAMTLAALSALAVASVGYLSFSTTRDRSLREVDASLISASRNDFGPGRDGELGGGRGRGRGEALFTVQILDADGRVIDSNSDLGLPVSAIDVEVARRNGRDVTRTVELADGSNVRMRTARFQGGAIQISRSLDEIDRVLHDLSERLLLIGAMVVAIAGIAGWFLARQLTKGLSRLTSAASEVSTTGRLDIDVSTSGRDEVGKLGTAFSTMLGALRSSREEQRRLVQDAGHELRTPLTSVRTNVDVLRKHTNMPAEMRERVLNDLDSEVAELSALVEEVVAVASGARPVVANGDSSIDAGDLDW